MNNKFFKSLKFFSCFLLAFTFCTPSLALPNNIDNHLTENNIQTKQEDFNCEVNCCFSIGQNCKAAYHIQRHGKRFQAAPLDWMRDCSLDTCIHFFKNKFADFFEHIEELGPWPGEYIGRTIRDTKNGVISIHHFLQKNPLNEEEHQKFRKMMLNRANKVDQILNKSESIALVYNQDCMESAMPDDQKLIEFLKSFSEIYPDKKIYLIVTKIENINDIKKKVVFDENNLKIIEYTFWDYGSNWTGNHSAWDKVMESIKIVKQPQKV